MAEKKPGIDQALIRDLANILNDTDLTEIEVERGGTPNDPTTGFTSSARSP